MAQDRSIYKIEDGTYHIFGNTWGNGQFGLIYSDDETKVRIKSTQNITNPIYWEIITEIEDGVGGFYADKADLEARGLPGFVGSGDNEPVVPKTYILAETTDTMVINDNKENPSFITGFSMVKTNGFEISDVATGTFKNISGRIIESMVGTVSFSPTETGGGTGVLHLMSERSIDGINWANNEKSLRTVEVAQNGESFGTKVSSIIDVLPNEMFRFRLVEVGAGGITLLSLSDVILGETVNSISSGLVLTEQ